MKAAMYKEYGDADVIKISSVEIPEVGEDDVLVKVHGSSVSPFDVRFRKGFFPTRVLSRGFLKPKWPILGVDLAGVVARTGARVTRFKEGDSVYGFSAIPRTGMGSNAQFVCVPHSIISNLPNRASFVDAAALPLAALTALQALRDKAQIEKGQRVLINGASGSVGVMALQLAIYYDTHVTAVCSTDNVELVKNLGAHEIIDYRHSDFTKSSKSYDIILDAVGKSSYFKCISLLANGGSYVTTDPVNPPYHLIQLLMSKAQSKYRAKTLFTKAKKEDLKFIGELVDQGDLVAVVEKCLPLEEITNAHRHVELGHTKGKVILSVD